MLGMTTETNNRLAFSIEECAALTSISKAMLRKEIKAGRLKIKRAGRRVLILKSDFMDYLNSEENAEVKTN
jgi:excisionase family DNA binding protein